MSQSERELVPDYDVGKKTDGYKPISIPKALKVIHGRMSNDLEVVEMTSRSVEGFVLAKEILSVFIYVKDLKKSKNWYSEVLGLNFGGFDGNRTNQLGVGLVLFEKENFSPCSESLFVIQTSNLEESYYKLKKLQVEVSEINWEINCFNFMDLDGNVITVWQ